MIMKKAVIIIGAIFFSAEAIVYYHYDNSLEVSNIQEKEYSFSTDVV